MPTGTFTRQGREIRVFRAASFQIEIPSPRQRLSFAKSGLKTKTRLYGPEPSPLPAAQPSIPRPHRHLSRHLRRPASQP